MLTSLFCLKGYTPHVKHLAEMGRSDWQDIYLRSRPPTLLPCRLPGQLGQVGTDAQTPTL